MDWRKRVQRRHTVSYIVCLVFVLALLLVTWLAYSRNEASRRWWQEVKQQLSPSQIRQRLKSTRYLQDARSAIDRQDWGRAEDLLKQATKVDPENREAWQLLITVLVRQNKWNEAEELVARIRNRGVKAEAQIGRAHV